jgi:hypothetical protein
MSGTPPVIPWNRSVAAKLTYDFDEDKTWISREGVSFFAGDFPRGAYTRLPNSINIFQGARRSFGIRTVSFACRQDL